jgi:hypothetical protein
MAVRVTTMSLTEYGVGSAWHSITRGVAVAGYVIAVVVVLTVAAFIISRLREVRLERRRPGGDPRSARIRLFVHEAAARLG